MRNKHTNPGTIMFIFPINICVSGFFIHAQDSLEYLTASLALQKSKTTEGKQFPNIICSLKYLPSADQYNTERP